jgi:glycosyltransferase involved in cell wall biosynthesis
LFAEGCAAAFVFAWTDEWHRGGCDIDDWDFGLTTRSREPKPALATVRNVFRSTPFPRENIWPMISVVICSYNGARTIGDALAALQNVRYLNFEVIVVDDGSTDATATLVRAYENVRLIQQSNRGLSAARNTGLQAARGEIVAYLDDDAAPDPHWLQYLAHAFRTTDFAGIAGPNIAFPDDNFIALCVDHSPGNPTHVLLTDREAEHLPGCNMAFRRTCLEAIGGFDGLFRIAGDDVDLCWRLQQRGWKLGFHAGAMVWHHRRNTIRAYWRQQFNYGRAEALLERKWPEKYNAAGHLAWNGRLYDKSFCRFLRSSRSRIYHGSWGSALFQHIYHPAPGGMQTLLVTPEWYLAMSILAAIASCGVFNFPARYGTALWVLMVLLPAIYALRTGQRTFFRIDLQHRHGLGRLIATTALLHWLQPIARATGRLQQGLTPWRRRGIGRAVAPLPRIVSIWSERVWRGAEQRLEALESAMRARGAVVARGGDWDEWDLAARGGVFGQARTSLVIEEHGSGKQLVRVRVSPMVGFVALTLTSVVALLAFAAAVEQKWTAWAVFTGVALVFLARMFFECGTAMAIVLDAAPGTLGDGEKLLSENHEART